MPTLSSLVLPQIIILTIYRHSIVKITRYVVLTRTDTDTVCDNSHGDAVIPTHIHHLFDSLQHMRPAHGHMPRLVMENFCSQTYICCWCSGTGKRYSNRKETSCVPLLKAGFEPGIPDTKSPADWMLADKPTELSRIKLKTRTRQPVPMISEHWAHLTPLSVDFRTWLWRYTYLLLLISMLWHRQAIFKSKGDKLCSSAESRIWTRDPRHQITSRLNARWQTDWAIEDQAKN